MPTSTLAVPQIATEYIRNRVQHDREARRWTELYARPKVANDKGKGKATTTAPAPSSSSAAFPALPSRSSAPIRASQITTPTVAETITIEDSDDEAPARTRRTVATAPSTRPKRKREVGTADIDLSADDPAERPTRKRRGGGGAGSVTNGNVGRTDPGEVIVIED